MSFIFELRVKSLNSAIVLSRMTEVAASQVREWTVFLLSLFPYWVRYPFLINIIVSPNRICPYMVHQDVSVEMVVFSFGSISYHSVNFCRM